MGVSRAERWSSGGAGHPGPLGEPTTPFRGSRGAALQAPCLPPHLGDSRHRRRRAGPVGLGATRPFDRGVHVAPIRAREAAEGERPRVAVEKEIHGSPGRERRSFRGIWRVSMTSLAYAILGSPWQSEGRGFDPRQLHQRLRWVTWPSCVAPSSSRNQIRNRFVPWAPARSSTHQDNSLKRPTSTGRGRICSR